MILEYILHAGPDLRVCGTFRDFSLIEKMYNSEFITIRTTFIDSIVEIR